MNSRAMRSFGPQRSGANQKGTAAIEFAIVATPLFFLITCILEFGMMSLGQLQLLNGAQNAARQLWLGNIISPAGASATEVATARLALKNILCEDTLLPGCVAGLRIEVLSGVDFAHLSSCPPTSPNCLNPRALAADGPLVTGNRTDAGAIVVSYDWNFFTPFTGIFANVSGQPAFRRLGEIIVYRNQHP